MTRPSTWQQRSTWPGCASGTAAARIRVQVEEAAADEVMVLTMAHDLASRTRSYELLADELGSRSATLRA